jgi:hypothetical protein
MAGSGRLELSFNGAVKTLRERERGKGTGAADNMGKLEDQMYGEHV